MSKRSQQFSEESQDTNNSVSENTKGSRGKHKQNQKAKEKDIFDKDAIEFQRKKDSKESSRNVVIFTGRALVEILRDQTMQKSFMTLAYICDMMIGSEISPLQKQKLLKIAKSYIGEGEYAAAIVSTTED